LVPIEFPAWVRCFVPDDWRSDDTDSLAVERWLAARNRWLVEHPAALRQFLDEFVASMSVPEWR
jgi:hypothetical protein